MSLEEARAALAAWGDSAALPELVKDRENAVYRVRLGDGRRAALRLHRAGYQTVEAIASELWWMTSLAAAGFPAPRPLPARHGGLLVTGTGPRAASLLEWLDGAAFGAVGEALSGTPAEQLARHHALGRLVARLHALADGLEPPRWFARPRWDRDGLVGERPFWGPFWENPALDDSERALLLATRDEAGAVLSRLDGQLDSGLIHADLLRENILLRADGSLALIDFDDCGIGYRLYDLATALAQSAGDPELPSRAEALVSGYCSIRALTPQEAALLPMFLTLRLCAGCGWHIPRAGGDMARLRRAAGLAVAAARGWRGGGGWPVFDAGAAAGG